MPKSPTAKWQRATFGIVAVVAATALAGVVPSVAEARSCGNLTVHDPQFASVGYSGFHVTNMECRSAAKVMRYVARHPRAKYALGYRITARQYGITGRNGGKVFHCYIYGTDRR